MRYATLLICVLLAACKPDDGAKTYQGYIEGEYVMLAPTTGGVLQDLNIHRGQQVAAGDLAFSLDTTSLSAERDAARAGLAQAQAEYADLATGERTEEIDVVLKQKEKAVAELNQAEREYNRTKPLVKQGAVSVTRFEQDKAAFETAGAAVAELEAKLKTMTLGARAGKLAAASASVDVAQQKLVQAEKLLKEASPVAPVPAVVEDTFYLPGEFVPAGRPVVSLLPPGNVKIRFFVPQSVMPQIKKGQQIAVGCDGCEKPVMAHVTFVDQRAEYTPPVIYSVESRDKLVFMIEAVPDQPFDGFRPGLPVDVSLGAP